MVKEEPDMKRSRYHESQIIKMHEVRGEENDPSVLETIL